MRNQFMNLKSVTAPPRAAYKTLSQNWDRPLPDGTGLADVYAWEEQRLNAMRRGEAEPIAYIWVPARSISLSRREAARLDLSAFDVEPLGIRGTGGTAVPQGPGTANITLFTRHIDAPGITEYYHQMCAALTEGFASLGLETEIGSRPGSFCDGAFNLLHQGKKLAGTAQRWCRARNGDTLGCHHVVVLTGGDPLDLCGRVEALYHQAGQPEEYVAAAHSELHLSVERLRDALLSPLTELVMFRT